jgi:cytochrome b561
MMNNFGWPLVSIAIMAIGILIGVFAVWRILEDRKSGFPAKDERTRRITGKAATYAFYIGSYFMIALMFVNLVVQELGLPSLDVGYTLIASILVQNLTYLGLRWYFNRKGDF